MEFKDKIAIREIAQHLGLTGHVFYKRSESGELLIDKNSISEFLSNIDDLDERFSMPCFFVFKNNKQKHFFDATLLPFLLSHGQNTGVFTFTMLPEMEDVVLKSTILRSYTIAHLIGSTPGSVRTAISDWRNGKLKRSNLIFDIYELKLLKLLQCD